MGTVSVATLAYTGADLRSTFLMHSLPFPGVQVLTMESN